MSKKQTITERREDIVLAFFYMHGPTMRQRTTHAFIRHDKRGGLPWTTKVLRRTMLGLEEQGKLRRERTKPRTGSPGELWMLAR